MIDYHGFWLGFLGLFVVLPAVVGAGGGLVWAWRRGGRGARLILPILVGAAMLGLCVAAGAVLVFRA